MLLSSYAFPVEISPLFSGRLLGGQYVFDTQESNLSGNISLLASPAIQVNEQWSLLPTLSSSWRGTKSVQELVGGGTLFQQTQDHAFNLKGVFSPNQSWRYKMGGGYRIQLLKETTDEQWGKGLYDFQKPSANLETEWIYSKEVSVRGGYDFYWIDFRNFTSLESQQKDLGRENATADTLDTTNHGVYLSANFPFPFLNERKGKAEFSYFYTFRNFADQKIVLVSGDLSGDLRRDAHQTVALGGSFPFALTEGVGLVTDIKGNFAQLKSDQNNYDAKKTQFNATYYSYRDFSVSSGFNFLFGKNPIVLTPGFSYLRRNYTDRPVQDSNGNYGSGSVHTNEYYANLSLTYPIHRNFKLHALTNFGWSRSNMKYEKTYRYNYTTFTYLFGILYDY
ncbi:MAG: hypothetical protein HYS58_01275 [Elusimicrobia bacterium]|nr:hypothetical protein [Elusimicrobiota bacterium]